MKAFWTGMIWLAAVAASPGAAAVDVDRYVGHDSFGTIKISPTGEYLAATMPLDDGERTALVVMRRSDRQMTGRFVRGKHTHIADFHWVNDERLLISAAEKIGSLEQPLLTGELFAVNADGSQAEILIGQRVQGRDLGTRIQHKKTTERVAAFLVDDLPADDRNVLVSVQPFGEDPYIRVELMDVYTGRRLATLSEPVQNASYTTDNEGRVRFAVGFGGDRKHKLYYRPAADDAGWELLNDEEHSGLRQWPVGFSADNATAYLEVEREQGPNAIVALDIATGNRHEVLVDDDSDPFRIIYRNNDSVPVGALYIDGKPRTAFFDEDGPVARQYRSLESALSAPVLITSRTADGNLTLVHTWSDRNPGDFYVYDVAGKSVDHLFSQRRWFDPRQMAGKQPVEIEARDGLRLHGYLTLPAGEGRNLPMVVMPHGGPIGVRDRWAFDGDVQMLAEAGYAVLQVNFRGSGGYGKAFTAAGARQWGRTMQDDLTDATRWAIDGGIAAADRICIAGASYGAYASLMGVVREPGLYRCAAGYVGVYDLPMMHTDGDVRDWKSGKAYLDRWLGPPADLAAISPNRLADRIRVPVFLAAGGQDERAPVEHTEKMEKALREAGVPVEALYYPDEGHGFYVAANRREYYTRLLDFLARHIGGEAGGDGGGTTVTAEEAL